MALLIRVFLNWLARQMLIRSDSKTNLEQIYSAVSKFNHYLFGAVFNCYDNARHCTITQKVLAIWR